MPTDRPMPNDAKAAMLRVVEQCGRFFHLSDIRRKGLEADYWHARRAGYFQDAGIETTVKADDALNAGAPSDAD